MILADAFAYSLWAQLPPVHRSAREKRNADGSDTVSLESSVKNSKPSFLEQPMVTMEQIKRSIGKMTIDHETLINFTTDIAAAHVSNNSVAAGDVGKVIESIYTALQKLGEQEPVVIEKPQGAVTIRSSIKPQHLVSMIDGKPYKMLKRHLSLNGYTPESYREAFNLPRDYPMVAAEYVEVRRNLAKKSGLGRKPGPLASKPTGKPKAKPAPAGE